ncbi:MAG: protein sorting system archaetidylserine decarboxylase [Haloferacaceae archaeon]
MARLPLDSRALGLPDLAPGTYRFALPPLLFALPALLVSPPVALLFALAGWAVVAFFRDPDRSPPASGVVAPADGRVSVVREEADRVRVGVFMNVTDVHVNRAPLPGTVTAVEHRSGGHLPAFTKESERNERVRVETDACEVTLIAGAVARRITPYVAPGDDLDRGERIGHVAFGSRADVLLPPAVDVEDLLVAEGDRVRAGETRLTAAAG